MTVCGCVFSFLKYLGASLGAVHDSVAAVEREGVLKFSQTFLSKFITGVNHPPVCLWDNNTVVICHLLHLLIFNIGSWEMLVNPLKKLIQSGISSKLFNGQP